MIRWCLVALLVSSCSVPNGDEWEPAVANGRYELSSLVCDSTNEAPAFRKPEQKLNFYAFENITTDQMIVQDGQVWRLMQDSECHLVQRTRIAVNDEGQFAIQIGKTSEFTPETCALTINYGGQDILVNTGNTAFFDSPTESEYLADVVYDVAATTNSYRLTSSASEGLSKVWEGYGCSVDDRIRFDLTAIDETLPN